MWDKLFASVDLLQQGLQASWLRDAVLRNNIANAETPGFKSSNVEFESVLRSAMEGWGFEGKMTRDKHIPIGVTDISSINGYAVQNNDMSMRMDENNVDIEAENVKLAKNTLLYNTMMTKLNSELTRMKLAIREGR